MTDIKRYDAIVIGAGQAGPGIAITLANEGNQVALIEGDKLGGTCLNYGCRPTKALRMSARVAHMARRAAEYGVNVGTVEVDFAAVMARKDDIIGGMQQGFWDYITDLDNLDIYYAYGKFVSTENGVHRVQAGDAVIESDQVYINVGARAFVPPIDGIDTVDYLTNKGILALQELPRHLLVLGGGYIGLEFGQMFRRFGSEVTIIESSEHVAHHADDDIIEHLEAMLRDEGVQLVTNHRAEGVTQADDGTITLTVCDKANDQTRTLTGSHLLVATGRRPNSDTLNLDAVGVATDDTGYITIDQQMRTNVPGIWALGDVNGHGAFTHTSYQEYEIWNDNRNGGDRKIDNRYMAYGVFVDPPIGHVGMGEKEAREHGRKVLKATLPFSSVSRAQLDSETVGLWKVLVDAETEEILGATVFGMQGDDVVQIASNFMYTGASYKVMRDALPVHPTVAEFWPTILGSLEPLE